jgi:hypothetical protein
MPLKINNYYIILLRLSHKNMRSAVDLQNASEKRHCGNSEQLELVEKRACRTSPSEFHAYGI